MQNTLQIEMLANGFTLTFGGNPPRVWARVLWPLPLQLPAPTAREHAVRARSHQSRNGSATAHTCKHVPIWHHPGQMREAHELPSCQPLPSQQSPRMPQA